MDVSLGTWLRQAAKLDGRAYDKALAECENEFVQSVEDLIALSSTGRLDKIFPQVIAAKIEQGILASRKGGLEPKKRKHTDASPAAGEEEEQEEEEEEKEADEEEEEEEKREEKGRQKSKTTSEHSIKNSSGSKSGATKTAGSTANKQPAALQPTSEEAEKVEANPEFPFLTDETDHAETPLDAYEDIVPILKQIAKCLGKKPHQLVIYDPYYCGGTVKQHMRKLGFPNCYNEREDFYAFAEGGAVGPGEYDVLMTNPPYSGSHVKRLMSFCAKVW
jgi:hypothetical protein